jgi:hypothetical protein
MSYDGIVIAPLVIFGVLCGLVALVTSGITRTLLATLTLATSALPAYNAFLGAASSVGLAPARYHIGQRLTALARHTGVDRAVALADLQWAAHDYVGSYLVWVLVPFVLGMAGLWMRRQRPQGVTATVIVATITPLVFAVVVVCGIWLRPVVTGTPTLDDPRWLFAHTEEIVASDVDAAKPAVAQGLVGYCTLLRHTLRDRTRHTQLARVIDAPRLARVERACTIDRVLDVLEVRLTQPQQRGDVCLALERMFDARRQEGEDFTERHHARFGGLLRTCGRPLLR